MGLTKFLNDKPACPCAVQRVVRERLCQSSFNGTDGLITGFLVQSPEAHGEEAFGGFALIAHDWCILLQILFLIDEQYRNQGKSRQICEQYEVAKPAVIFTR